MKKKGFIVLEKQDVSELFGFADVMVSDTSSAMFEFATTGKPVVVIDETLWLTGEESLNSTQGPEYVFRGCFFRARKAEGLEKKIDQALAIGQLKKSKEIKQIFTDVENPAEKAAKEIKKYARSQVLRE